MSTPTYAMFGLGKTGQATAQALSAQGAKVIAWDDGEAGRAAFAKAVPAVSMKSPQDWPWASLDAVVLSPGVPLTHPQPHAVVQLAKQHGARITGDIELLWQQHPDATYIGITGTNGKSTTTTLTGHIFLQCGKTAAIGGNLGMPVMALPVMDEGGAYILELSSYQLDLCDELRLNTALVLNFSPDHLDRHGSMAGYVEAKRRIFRNQTARDVAIIGVDDADANAMHDWLVKNHPGRVVPISARSVVAGGVYVQDGILVDATSPSEQRFDLRGIKALQGEHNWQNAAAAYAICAMHNIAPAAIYAAMQHFAGLDHRMQWLGEARGVAYVNDSKATNADAAEKALKTYDKIHWIIGGVAKDGGIESLAPYFGKIAHAYLIGQAAPEFANTLEGRVPYTQCGTLDVAFTNAAAHAKAGEVVVLAPACASFDQYPNFEARGAHFKQMFTALKESADVHA